MLPENCPKMRFSCSRCPAEFAQFKELVKHWKTKHEPSGYCRLLHAIFGK